MLFWLRYQPAFRVDFKGGWYLVNHPHPHPPCLSVSVSFCLYLYLSLCLSMSLLRSVLLSLCLSLSLSPSLSVSLCRKSLYDCDIVWLGDFPNVINVLILPVLYHAYLIFVSKFLCLNWEVPLATAREIGVNHHTCVSWRFYLYVICKTYPAVSHFLKVIFHFLWSNEFFVHLKPHILRPLFFLKDTTSGI